MKHMKRALVLLGLTACAVAAPPEPTLVNVDDVVWENGPEEGITLKRFNGQLARLNVVRWVEGTLAAPHTHATEQLILVQSGRYRVTLEDREVTLEAGDLMIFPSYLSHGIEALEDSAHIAVFAPAALPPTEPD